MRSSKAISPTDSYPRFLKRLVRLRKKKSLSQREMAKRLQMTQAWVSLIERGLRRLRSEADVRSYAIALEYEPKDLVSLWNETNDQDMSCRIPTSVIPASDKREAAEDRRKDKEQRVYVAPGVSLATLKDLLRNDESALVVVRSLCKLHEERQRDGPAARSRGKSKPKKETRK